MGLLSHLEHVTHRPPPLSPGPGETQPRGSLAHSTIPFRPAVAGSPRPCVSTLRRVCPRTHEAVCQEVRLGLRLPRATPPKARSSHATRCGHRRSGRHSWLSPPFLAAAVGRPASSAGLAQASVCQEVRMAQVPVFGSKFPAQCPSSEATGLWDDAGCASEVCRAPRTGGSRWSPLGTTHGTVSSACHTEAQWLSINLLSQTTPTPEKQRAPPDRPYPSRQDCGQRGELVRLPTPPAALKLPPPIPSPSQTSQIFQKLLVLLPVARNLPRR